MIARFKNVFFVFHIFLLLFIAKDVYSYSQAERISYRVELAKRLFKQEPASLNFSYNDWNSGNGVYCDNHGGIDVQTKSVVNDRSKNESFFAISEGVVIAAGGEYGMIAVYDSTKDWTTFYLHARSIDVVVGQSIQFGQLLGIQGNTSPTQNLGVHVHFEARSGRLTSAYCYGDVALKTLDPVMVTGYYIDKLANSVVYPRFHGAGSLISPSSSCGVGCSYDYVAIHPDGTFPLAVFQWTYDQNYCDHVDLIAEGKNRSIIQPMVRVRAGAWYGRQGDQEYVGSLPMSIGYPRQSWNVIAVTVLNKPDQATFIRAECRGSNTTVGKKTLVATSNPQGVALANGYTWNGNGSLITNLSPERTGFGVTKDVVAIKSVNGQGSGAAFFQWYKSPSCEKVGLSSSNSGLHKVRVRSWDQKVESTIAIDGIYLAPTESSWVVPQQYTSGYGYYLISVFPDVTGSTGNESNITLSCLF